MKMKNKQVERKCLQVSYAHKDEAEKDSDNSFSKKYIEHGHFSGDDQSFLYKLAKQLGLSKEVLNRKGILKPFVAKVNEIVDDCNNLNDELSRFYNAKNKRDSASKIIDSIVSLGNKISTLNLEELGIERSNLEQHTAAISTVDCCMNENTTIKELLKLEANLSNPNNHDRIKITAPISVFEFVNGEKTFSLYELISDQLMGNARFNYAKLGMGAENQEQFVLLQDAEIGVNKFIEIAQDKNYNPLLKEELCKAAMIRFIPLLKSAEPLGFSPKYISDSKKFAKVLNCVNAIIFDREKLETLAPKYGTSKKPIDIICGLLLQASGYNINSLFEKTIIDTYGEARESLKLEIKPKLIKAPVINFDEKNTKKINKNSTSKTSSKQSKTYIYTTTYREENGVVEKLNDAYTTEEETDEDYATIENVDDDDQKYFPSIGWDIEGRINYSDEQNSDSLEEIFRRKEEDRIAAEQFALENNLNFHTTEVIPQTTYIRTSTRYKELRKLDAIETAKKKQTEIDEFKNDVKKYIQWYIMGQTNSIWGCSRYPDLTVDIAKELANKYEDETIKQKATNLAIRYSILATEFCIKNEDYAKAETYYNYAIENRSFFADHEEKLKKLDELSTILGKEPILPKKEEEKMKQSDFVSNKAIETNIPTPLTQEDEEKIYQEVMDYVEKKYKNSLGKHRITGQHCVLLNELINLKTKRSIEVIHKEMFLDKIEEKLNSSRQYNNDNAICKATNCIKKYIDNDEELPQSLLQMCDTFEGFIYDCLNGKPKMEQATPTEPTPTQISPIENTEPQEEEKNVEEVPVNDSVDAEFFKEITTYLTKRRHSCVGALNFVDCEMMKEIFEIAENRNIEIANKANYSTIVTNKMNSYKRSPTRKPINYDNMKKAIEELAKYKAPSIKLPTYVGEAIASCCTFFDKYYQSATENGFMKKLLEKAKTNKMIEKEPQIVFKDEPQPVIEEPQTGGEEGNKESISSIIYKSLNYLLDDFNLKKVDSMEVGELVISVADKISHKNSTIKLDQKQVTSDKPLKIELSLKIGL